MMDLNMLSSGVCVVVAFAWSLGRFCVRDTRTVMNDDFSGTGDEQALAREVPIAQLLPNK
jgi:hypothetical protein